MCVGEISKRFLANPGDGIRINLVEGKSRAKLLISPPDNASPRSSSCHSQSVNLPSALVCLSLLMYSTAVLFFKVTKKVSLWAGCLPVRLVCLPLSVQLNSFKNMSVLASIRQSQRCSLDLKTLQPRGLFWRLRAS